MRRRIRTHSNTERWILSYADFVTLLFALFVAMYAISQQDKTSPERFSKSVREAVESGGVPTAIQSLMDIRDRKRLSRTPASAPQEKLVVGDPSLAKPFAQLSLALKDEINSGKVALRLETRGIVVTLREQSFFPSGDDTIYTSSYPTIGRVASVVLGLPNPIQLEGHTDSIPIHTPRFGNNWELSTARSIALLQLFRSKFGIESNRFVVAGYAQNAPVAQNDTEEGRALNRRVEIVILSR